ncbi:sensor histidine kinase [Streptomyces sp. NRRL F-5123]|uniref:sensor histidine kinase n=1 Tax=Streptomyces sp. NRRL F-5123 TaxID=1463856 RepID=UPI000B1CE33B|nr:histidine kinase [Streptomyces sp. NRRL F-5123]
MSTSEPVGPVSRMPQGIAVGVARTRAALAGLLPPAPPPARRSPPQPLSRWAWTADVIAAVVLAAATAYATANGATGDGPFRSGAKIPADVPGIPRLPEPPPLPDGRPFVVDPHLLVQSAPQPALWLIVLGALTALPLAVRRRWPLSAFTAVLGSSLLFHSLTANSWSDQGVEDPSAAFTLISTVLTGYAAALYSPYRRRAIGALVTGGVLLLAARHQALPSFSPSFVPFALLLPLGLAANAVHIWRQRMRTMQAEQAAATQLAVEHERARIARELHDVVTHNVSMMTVQAGAARTVLDKEPELAREALLAVESAGRAAMAELRHVMGLLSMTTTSPGAMDPDGPQGAPEAELAPQPGLGQVGALADRVRGTGMAVAFTVTGTPVPLPAGVDLAAYRVAQEALTNTVKHASGASVTVSVAYRPGEVHVEVADTGGTPSPSASAGNGRGLMGLRERLAVYGGTLDAGRRISGGYRVRAVIPVGDA